jgi:ComF family protein
LPLPFERCACHHVSDELARVRAVAPLTGWLHQAIVSFKYEGEWARAEHLGTLLASAFDDLALSTVDGIVPVPLHPNRERERGFNQAAMLAERVGVLVGRPVVMELQRVRDTPHQVGLSAGERSSNVEGAFVATGDVTGRNLVLIDDVLTTGATINAAAKSLATAGAAQVSAVVLARQGGSHNQAVPAAEV